MTRSRRGDPDLPPGPARDLVDLFRRLRRAAPLSGGQIAVKTGLSSGHVSEVLRGWKAPSADTAAKISLALGAGQDVVRRAVSLAEELTELNRYHRGRSRARAPREADALPSGLAYLGDAGRGAAALAALWAPPHAARPVLPWPRRVGVVPPPAQCLLDRPEAADLAGDLTRTGASAAPVQVLSGLGGVGKTQLAVACAERLFAAGAVDLLVWITAGSRAEIETGLAQASLEVTGITDADASQGARRFLAWLATTRRRWLVVLDDLASPADLAGLWPPAPEGGRTLITTRRRDASLTGPGRQVLDVGLFSAAEATTYLEARLAGHAHLLDAPDALAADLGFLPLALAQAAAYLIDRDLTCGQYRARLADRRTRLASLLPEPEALPDAYHASAAATWSLSVELADRLFPAGLARPLLELAGVLDSHGIPAEVFTSDAVRDYLGRRRQQFRAAASVAAATADDVDVVGPEQARDGLHCLARLSLVTLDPGSSARSVRVHALVQRFARENVPPGQLADTMTSAGSALAQTWPQVERDPGLSLALRACTHALADHDPGALWTPEPHPVLFRAGRSLGESGAASAAARYFEHVVTTARRMLSPEHPDALAARHEMLHWRGEAGDQSGAIAGLLDLLTDQERILGADHPRTLAARHEIALRLGQQGDAAGAVAAYESLAGDRRRILGPGHADTLAARGNLAWWRGRAGDAEAACAEFVALLADLERILGPDHHHTLAARHNLAYWRGHGGDCAGAVAGFGALVADLTRVAGADHPDTLSARNSLAWWRGQAGDAAGAALQFEDLLADLVRVLGPDHRLTSVTRRNLAYWRAAAAGPGQQPGASTAPD